MTGEVFAVLFISFGIAAADVAHLERSYLPPVRTVALPSSQISFTGSRTSSFSTHGGYSDRLIQAAPATSYTAPGAASFASTNFVAKVSSPAKFTAPVSQDFIASVPQKLVALPPQSFIVAAPQKFIAPASQNLIAPASQNFVAPAPAPAAAFAAQKFTSAPLALPSRQYLSPEVETFEPLVVKQSYTAPAITYSAPATASSSASSAFTAGSSGIETQYSSDGGYVY